MKSAFYKKPDVEHNRKVDDHKCKLWLQAVLDNAEMSIMALQAVRDEEGTLIDFEYVFMNKAAEESVNLTNLTGKRFLKEFPAAKPSGLFDHYKKVTEDGIPWNDEIYYEDNGYKCWASVKVTKLEDGCLIMYSDITDRKKAEQEAEHHKAAETQLVVSHQKLNEILNSIQEDFFVIDRVWNFVYASKVFTSKLGKEPEDLIGRNVWEMFSKHKGTDFEENFRAAMEKREIRKFEIRGKYTDAYYSISVFPSDEGITVLGTDVTEQKIQEYNYFINQITDVIPDTICVLEYPSLKVLFTNRKSLENREFETDEIKVLTSQEGRSMVHSEDHLLLQEYQESVHGLQADGMAVTEYRVKNKEGKWIWFRARGKVFERSKNGEVKSVLHIIQNVTPVKEAEQKIREQNHFITGITQTIPDAISVIKLPSRELIYANHQPLGMLGFDVNDLAKMSPEERRQLVHPNDLPALEEYFNRLITMQDGGMTTLEYRAKNKDGEWLWFHVRGNVFERNADGKVESCLNVLQNITARKEAEKETRENKDLLQSILDVSINSLSVLKSVRNIHNEIIDFEYILGNKTLEKTLQKGTLTGKLYTEIYPNAKEDGWFDILKDVVENNTMSDFERPFNLHGKEDWFHVIAQKFDDGMIVTSSKITQRKEAEEKIKEQSLFIKRVTESVPDIISVTEIPFPKVKYLNKNPYDTQAFTPQEIVGMSLEERKELIHPEDYANLLNYYAGFLRLTDDDIATARYRRKNESGEWLWFQTHGKVFQRDNNGNAISSVNIVRDITEQIKAEEEIREQSHFIRQITDTSPDILYVFDLVEEKIVYINKGIYYSLGYSPEDIYAMEDKLTKSLFHPKDYNRRIAHIVSMATIEPGEVRDMELRLKDDKGKWHWYNVRETFFKAAEDGSTRQILGIGQDITDKKEVQAAFREEKIRNEKLRRINELMDTFVYAAAHDLKAPVANLKLVTEIIGGTQETALRLQLQNKYPPIIKALDNTISGLINVLAIEKSSQSTLNELSFQDIYNTVIGELEEEVLEATPEFTLNFSNCLSIIYIESYLTSVFRNMLSNSLKYRSKEKNLTINIESKRYGKYILLTFRDNGIGIDLGYYGKDLFKPFKRFHTLSEGSGIGLHLIKNMVTKNGGRIEVESNIDTGSTFKIYLVPYNK